MSTKQSIRSRARAELEIAAFVAVAAVLHAGASVRYVVGWSRYFANV
jgi:hypothetical protein